MDKIQALVKAGKITPDAFGKLEYESLNTQDRFFVDGKFADLQKEEAAKAEEDAKLAASKDAAANTPNLQTGSLPGAPLAVGLEGGVDPDPDLKGATEETLPVGSKLADEAPNGGVIQSPEEATISEAEEAPEDAKQ